MTKKKRPEEKIRTGRPPHGPFKILHTRIPPELKNALEDEAAARSIPVSALVALILRRRYARK